LPILLANFKGKEYKKFKVYKTIIKIKLAKKVKGKGKETITIFKADKKAIIKAIAK
jgi:hypothetical protein